MTAPLAWLIDTNVVSEMMRPRPEPRVAAFLDAIEAEGIGLASITVWEVLDGIGRLAHGRRRRGLTDRFHDLLDELFEDRIVAWTLADARACGSWRTSEGEARSSTITCPTLPRGGGAHARARRRYPEHGGVPQHRRRERGPLDSWAAVMLVLTTGMNRVLAPLVLDCHNSASYDHLADSSIPTLSCVRASLQQLMPASWPITGSRE